MQRNFFSNYLKNLTQGFDWEKIDVKVFGLKSGCNRNLTG